MKKNLVLILISMAVWGLGEGMFFFFQPIYLQELGADPVTIGFILGLVAFVMVLVHIPSGYISDRFGRRPLIWAAWIIGTLSIWILALAPDLPTFVLGMIIYGSTMFVAVPLSSYVTAARGAMSVGRVLTFSSAAFNSGMILGPFIGGFIGQAIGLKTTFFIAGFIFLISTALILFIGKQEVEASVHENAFEGIASILKPRFTIFLLLSVLTIFVLYLPQPLTQNFLQNERGISLSTIGIFLSARSVGIVCISLFLGNFDARKGFILAQVGVAIFALMLWKSTQNLGLLVGYFLLGSYQTARSLTNAQARILVEARNMGLSYGLVETAASTAIIAAPVFAGILYKINPIFVYPISLFLILVMMVVNIILTPYFRLNSHQS